MDFNERYKDAHLSKVELPLEIMEKINKWLAEPKGMFIFCGNPGLGKTYLCWAIKWHLQEKNAKNRYFSLRFMDEKNYYSALRKVIELDWDYAREIERLCDCDYFILDDVMLNYDKEWHKEVIFTLIDLRYTSKRPTIFTSNLWMHEIEQKLDKRIISRLRDKDNLIIELDWIDKRRE